MKSAVILTASLLSLAALVPAAQAASIDMDDPHRALGREGDVRIDAQLAFKEVTAGAPIGVTYQVQNLSDEAVAVAGNQAQASYDADTRTITLALGSEIPPDGKLPRMALIEPGETKVFQASAVPQLSLASTRGPRAATPRYVRIKVAILRDVEPFAGLIERRSTAALPDDLFERWFEASETIFLNELPVYWNPERPVSMSAAERSAAP